MNKKSFHGDVVISSGAGEFSGRLVNRTKGAGVTKHSWGLRDHKEFEFSEAVAAIRGAARKRG